MCVFCVCLLFLLKEGGVAGAALPFPISNHNQSLYPIGSSPLGWGGSYPNRPQQLVRPGSWYDDCRVCACVCVCRYAVSQDLSRALPFLPFEVPAHEAHPHMWKIQIRLGVPVVPEPGQPPIRHPGIGCSPTDIFSDCYIVQHGVRDSTCALLTWTQ